MATLRSAEWYAEDIDFLAGASGPGVAREPH